MFSNQTFGTAVSQDTEHHRITIDPFGRATIEGMNFKGDVCGIMGEALRRSIGGGGSDGDSKKPEYYDTTSQNQTTNW